MKVRVTNWALLGTLTVLAATGAYGLFFQLDGWAFEVHRIGAWVFLALIPWKAGISLRSLRRNRAMSLPRAGGILLALGLTVIAMAVTILAAMWMLRLGPTWMAFLTYTDTVASWHWILGLGSLPLLAAHTLVRWVRPRRTDWINRRGFLRLAGLGTVGALGWRAGESLAGARQLEGSARRYTGSREEGSFSGRFPVTTGAGDGQLRLDPAHWRLAVRGAVRNPLALGYAEVLELRRRSEVVTLDCTIGWYTQQVWGGVPLRRLLEAAGIHPGVEAIRLTAVGGYSHAYTMPEADRILLATHVAGRPLAHEHGFPLRAVSPAHRGWFWVKWITTIEALPGWEA